MRSNVHHKTLESLASSVNMLLFSFGVIVLDALAYLTKLSMFKAMRALLDACRSVYVSITGREKVQHIQKQTLHTWSHVEAIISKRMASSPQTQCQEGQVTVTHSQAFGGKFLL